MWQKSHKTQAPRKRRRDKAGGEQGEGQMATQSATAPPRPEWLLNHKLSACLPPLAEEAAVLLDLTAATRTLRPGQEIVSEGRRCSMVSLMVEGVAIRYRILRDGQRQILRFLLPGDF